MKDRFYLFIFFILLALAFWGAGYLFAPDFLILIFSLVVAYVFGFVGLFFLGLYLRDELKERRKND